MGKKRLLAEMEGVWCQAKWCPEGSQGPPKPLSLPRLQPCWWWGERGASGARARGKDRRGEASRASVSPASWMPQPLAGRGV